jgi:hypothetical protein
MRSEFRFNRRYGRRTVAKWSRRGYRTRGYSSARSSKATYSVSRPTSSSVSAGGPPSNEYVRGSVSGNGLDTGCRDFFLGLCFVLAVILSLCFFLVLF